MTLYQKFVNLGVVGSRFGLEAPACGVEHFCTPKGARVIGCEGSIQYCFIRGYGEIVFAVNPGSCTDGYVYPLAANFRDFLRLILACGSVTAIEQIVWWTEEQFEDFLKADSPAEGRQEALDMIRDGMKLVPMENPYQYVKAVQSQVILNKIRYSDAYYDVLGIENPSGRKREEPIWEEVVEIRVYRKTETAFNGEE